MRLEKDTEQKNFVDEHVVSTKYYISVMSRILFQEVPAQGFVQQELQMSDDVLKLVFSKSENKHQKIEILFDRASSYIRWTVEAAVIINVEDANITFKLLYCSNNTK